MQTDFDLLDAWRDGDNVAGNALFDRHFTPLFRFFHYKVPDQADDLVQQTLLACVKSAKGFRKDSSFRTYMFRVARSKLYDAVAKMRRDGVVDVGVTSMIDLGESPSRLLARDEDQHLLVQALRRLPLELQIVVELRFFEHMRGPQIAEVLEVPEGTVRSRIRRAVETLRSTVVALSASPEDMQATGTRLQTWADQVRDNVAAPDDPQSE